MGRHNRPRPARYLDELRREEMARAAERFRRQGAGAVRPQRERQEQDMAFLIGMATVADRFDGCGWD